MKTAIKTIELSDYEEISAEVACLKMTHARLQQTKARVDVGHTHKFWEWGRAYKAIEEVFPSRDINVLDIGAAYGLLGPTLAWWKGCNVTEAEPDPDCLANRAIINKFHESYKCKTIHLVQAAYGNLKERLGHQFHVVCSISVIEHVDLWLEKLAWVEMVDLLLPGGILIVTMDCMPEARKGFMFDQVRWTNYDMEMVRGRVEHLENLGMKPLGAVDYAYHGAQVHDYSFASIIMVKQ